MSPHRLLNITFATLVSGFAIALTGIVLAQSGGATIQAVPDGTPPPDPLIRPAVRQLENWTPAAQPVDTDFSPMSAQGTVTITTEGFEGTFPGAGWDSNTDHWGASSCKAKTGLKSAWVEGNGGLTCGASYHNNEQSWMIYGPFSLSDAASAQLAFSSYITSELGFDYLFWGSAITSTFFGFETSGNSNGWIDQTFDLSDRAGESAVYFAFVWAPNSTINRPEGAYVDDVALTKTSFTNLDVQKDADRSSAEAGEALTYTISILNNGAVNIPSARLTDTLPISVSLVGGTLTANGGSVGASGGVITWTGGINVGQTARITYSVMLTNSIPNGTVLVNPVIADDGAGFVYNAQESVVVGASRTYLPAIMRNFCNEINFTDPGFASQPDMVQINADDAWRACVLSDPSIVVAIIDTGVDLDHPDLAANLVPGYDYIDNDAVPEDGNGHGSNVAGIAGAAINGIGVVGVGPKASLRPVRVLDDQGSGSTSAVANGINYAANNAHILNLSLSTVSDNATVRSAIAYAVNTRGRLVVAAAGNCGDPSTYFLNNCTYVDQPNYPAAYSPIYPNVMAVAAVNGSDQQASFSNENSYVTISAPGVSIYNADKDGGYTIESGTSQAAPHVAGLAALIWAQNPSYNATQVRQAIETTAVDLGTTGRDNKYGWGRIDVVPAVGLTSVASNAAEPDAAGLELSPPVDHRDAEFVPGRILIKFTPDVSAAGIAQALSAFEGVAVEGEIGQLDIRMLSVPVGQEWQLIDQLRALPNVEFAEPDYIIHLNPDPLTP